MSFILDSMSPARLYPATAGTLHPFDVPRRLMQLPASVLKAAVAPTATDEAVPVSLGQKVRASAVALSRNPVAHGLLAPATVLLTGGTAPLILTGALGMAALLTGTGITPAHSPDVRPSTAQKMGHAIFKYGLGGCLFEGLGVAVGRYGASLRRAPDAGLMHKIAGFGIEAVCYTLAIAAGFVGFTPRLVIAAAVATFLLVQGTVLVGTGLLWGAAHSLWAGNKPSQKPSAPPMGQAFDSGAVAA